MPVTKTQGLQLAIATSYLAVKSMTAVSKAANAVATLEASHGVAAQDIVEVTSGWKYLDGRIVRVSAVSTNDVTLEGMDTQSSDFPTGEGVGSVREITGWTRITGLLPDIGVSGGGFAQIPAGELDDVRDKNIPGLAQAVEMDFQFHFPAASAWRSLVESAARTGVPTAYRMSIGTVRIYGNAYWGFLNEPQPQSGKLVGSIKLSTVADSVYYAS